MESKNLTVAVILLFVFLAPVVIAVSVSEIGLNDSFQQQAESRRQQGEELSQELYKKSQDKLIYLDNQFRPRCERGGYYPIITDEYSQGESITIGTGFADPQKAVKIVKITPTHVDISVTGGLPPLDSLDILPKQITLRELEERTINGLRIVIGQNFTENKVMLCITETQEHKSRATCSGCFADSKCLPIGTRIKSNYCNLDKNFESQKGKDVSCNNNYECVSNVCADNKCIPPSFWQGILSWFASLFGL